MALEDLTTGLDLFKRTMAFASQSEATTDDYASHAKAAIREAYWRILTMEPWTFALASSPGVITTVAEVKATASSISGTAVTLSATIAASMAGRKFYINNNQSMYRISAHTAGTDALTLDATYVDTPTSGACTIYRDEYALNANAMRVWGPLSLRGQFEGEIDLIGPKEFKEMYGSSRVTSSGITEAATEIREDSSGVKQIQIAPWSTDALNIEYDYTEFHDLDFSGAGAGDTPKLRREYRWVISEFALSTLFRNKNDKLAGDAYNRAIGGVNDMRTAYLGTANRNRMWVRPHNSLWGG